MHSTIKPLKFNTAHLDNIMAQGVAELEKDFPIKVDAAGIPVVFKKTASSVIAVSFKNGLCEIEADCSPHFYFKKSNAR